MVPFRVISKKNDKGKAKASCNPARLNKHLSPNVLAAGLVIHTSVVSLEEKGAILDVDLDQITGFIQKAQFPASGLKEGVSIYSTKPALVMAILPNDILGSLEYLGLNSKNNGAKLEEIVELEQWKGLKRSYLQTVPDSFPIEHFFHLEVFKIVQIKISEDRLVKMRDILLKSSKFSECALMFKIEDYVNVDENGEEVTLLRALDILINRVM